MVWNRPCECSVEQALRVHPGPPFGAQQMLLRVKLRARHHLACAVQALVLHPDIGVAVMQAKVAHLRIAKAAVGGQQRGATRNLYRLVGKVLAKNQRRWR